MKSIVFASTAALLAGLGLGVSQTDIPEPALEFTLSVDGEQRDIQLGEEFVLELGGRKHRLLLKAQPTRTFEGLGLRFDYPAHFTYEYSGVMEGLTFVTLEGPSASVMLQAYGTVVSNMYSPESLLGTVVEAAKAEFGELDVEDSESKLTLGDSTYASRRLELAIASTRLVQEYAVIETGDSMLILIWSPTVNDEDGRGTTASEETWGVISGSFELTDE